MPNGSNIGWGTALTEHGDDLARVAFRELGDAKRWVEIAWLNDLRPPYLTGDREMASASGGHVVVWGEPIRVPRPNASRQGATPIQAYGIDLSLDKGHLDADALGGLALVSGVPNLKQALELRLRNDLGCLRFHPRYGNDAGRLRGYKNNENIRLLALRFCEESVLGDPRVKSVKDGTERQFGDTIKIELTAMVEDGTALRLQAEI